VKFLSGENPLVESEMNFSIDRGKRWRHVSEAQAAKAVKQVILFFICLSKALAVSLKASFVKSLSLVGLLPRRKKDRIDCIQGISVGDRLELLP